MTAAERVLHQHNVTYTAHEYRYEPHGGTNASSLALGVDEHVVVKTLVMQDENREPLIILMHGDREVGTRQLARQAGRKSVTPCDPTVAQRHTGYMVGGTSPFGARKAMPVYVERTILDLSEIFINGGRRGLLVCINPQELVRVLKATAVEVAVE